MSTKCSSGAVPGGVLGYLSRTPGEAQRSGFAGKRRSKEAVAVFAARRKRRQADFATTSRRGQSHSPPAGGETPLRTTNAVRTLSPHPSRLRRAAFPYPLCRFATSPLDKGSRPPREGFWGRVPVRSLDKGAGRRDREEAAKFPRPVFIMVKTAPKRF